MCLASLSRLRLWMLVVVATCSCGVPSETSDSLIDAGIVIDDSKENTVPGVMWIGNCSSTAVSTNTLITAAHCVDKYRILGDGKVVGNVSIHSGKHTGKRGVKLFVPSGYTKQDNMHMAFDVAVAVFDEGTFDSFFAVRPAQDKPRAGERGLLVGYSAENPEPGARSNKRWGEITISNFLSNITIVSRFGGNSRAVAVSPGDSGGPAFNEACQLYGVASRMSEGGVKQSLHTNLTFDGNAQWMNALAAEGAYICGVHGLDPTRCPASGLAQRVAQPRQGEFPCMTDGSAQTRPELAPQPQPQPKPEQSPRQIPPATYNQLPEQPLQTQPPLAQPSQPLQPQLPQQDLNGSTGRSPDAPSCLGD